MAAYNLTKAEVPMQAAVGPDDYADAGCMIQPYPGRWAIPDEGLVVWDWYAARGQKLAGDYSFTLSPLADRLLLLAPVRYGWAVIGRTDKYLSPAAAAVQSVSRRELRLTLAEAGPMTIYSAGGPPMARGLDFVELGKGFWRADMPVGARNVKLVIRR